MRRPYLVSIGVALATLVAAGSATAIPLRGLRVTANGPTTVGARADTYLPPTARYCHAFVRSYLMAAGPDRWYVIGRYGKFRVNYQPCRDGQWDVEGVGVRFRDTGGGERRICFEAWTPLASGAISRHYGCTASFYR